MAQIQIAVDTTNAKSVQEALLLLQILAGKKAPEAPINDVVAPDDDEELDLGGLGEEEEEDDMLGDLLDEEEEEVPEFPSIEDMKEAFKDVIKSKGKDEGTDYVKKVLAKLKAKGMKDVPEDRREAFISVLLKFAAKK